MTISQGNTTTTTTMQKQSSSMTTDPTSLSSSTALSTTSTSNDNAVEHNDNHHNKEEESQPQHDNGEEGTATDTTNPTIEATEATDPTNTTATTIALSEEEQRQRKWACYKKLAIALILVAIIVFVVIDSLTNGYVRDGVNSFLEWIENNPGPGVIAFAVVYFVATVLFIPGSILTLGAGFVFSASFGLGIGVLLGSLSVFVGASAGAIVSFLLGRYLLRDSVGKLSEKYSIFQALDNAFASKGFRIMVLLRLSPIIPFNAINYIAGVSALKFAQYLWSLFAILPGTILYVFLGASASSLADSAMGDDNSTVTIVVVVIGVIFGIFAIAMTSYYARQELNKVVAQRQAELEQANNNDNDSSSSPNDNNHGNGNEDGNNIDGEEIGTDPVGSNTTTDIEMGTTGPSSDKETQKSDSVTQEEEDRSHDDDAADLECVVIDV